MKLYHGSTVPVMAPNVNFAQVGRDLARLFTLQTSMNRPKDGH